MAAFLIAALICAVAGLNWLWFARSIPRCFIRPEPGTAPGVLTLTSAIFAVAQMIVHLRTEDWEPSRVAAGLALCIVATWLFRATVQANLTQPLSVAGSQDLPQHLNQTGPYARIRHPYYCAYLCNWLGSGLASPHWWMLLPFVVMSWMYWRAAASEEMKFQRSALAEEYERYRARAGMFWPRFW
jgi:protein-S-isoprenylcysteine O-methyltransferase Ste14